MDTSQWPQGIGVMEGGGARRTRPQKDEALNCPRCSSTNTKFCYYNNYSLSQPRYFCKTCRRYWTDGGSLRNVPVGGGSRKNKRSSSSIPSSSSAGAANNKIKLDHVSLAPPTTFLPQLASSDQNPSKIHYQGQDLNLAYPPTSADHHYISKFVIEMPQYQHDQNPNTTTTTTSAATTTTATPAMELFKTGIANPRGLMSPFMSMPGSDSSTMYPSNGFNPLQEFKPSGALNFSLDGLEGGGGYGQETNGARLLFPFEDANSRGQGDSAAAGYWSGMLGGDGGGGGSW